MRRRERIADKSDCLAGVSRCRVGSSPLVAHGRHRGGRLLGSNRAED
jgi:hypothetical protein